MALVGILDGAHAVDAVGGIYIADARIVLHQGEQEADVYKRQHLRYT